MTVASGKIFYCFIIFFSICASQPGFKDLHTDADRLFLATLDLYCDSVYQYAYRECSNVLSENLTDLKSQDIAWIKADCSCREGEFLEAIKNYESYLRSVPAEGMSNAALFRIALCYEKAGELPASMEIFKKVLGNTEDPEAAASSAVRLAEIFLRQEDSQNAEKYFLLAYENYPAHAQQEYALLSLARILQKEKKYEAAEKRYEEYRLTFPRGRYEVYAVLQAVQCMFNVREYKEADLELETLKSTFLTDDERSMADCLRAASFYQQGKYDESERYYKIVIEGTSKASLKLQIQYALGWAYFKGKNYSEAAEYWRKVAEVNTRLSAEAVYLLSVALEREGMIDSAFAATAAALNSRPENVDDRLMFQAGTLSYQKRNLNRADEYFQKIRDFFPASELVPAACFMRGECSFASGQYAEAKKYYKAAEQCGNAKGELPARILLKMGLTAYHSGNYRTADSLLTDYIKRYPADSLAGDAAFICAEADYRFESFEKAEQLFDQQAKETSGDRQAWCFFRRGLSLFRQNKYEAACSVLKDYLAGHRGAKYEWSMALSLADISSLIHNDQTLIDRYRTLFNLAQDSLLRSITAYRLAVCFLRIGERSGAYKSFEDALRENPHSESADRTQFALAWINYQSKEYLDALQDVRTCIRMYPAGRPAPRAWILAGDCLAILKRWTEAEDAYTAVLEEYPQSIETISAAQGMQYCLHEENKKKEALDFADHYISLHPRIPFADAILAKKADTVLKTIRDASIRDTAMLFDLPAAPENEIPLSKYSMPVRLNEKEIDVEAVLPKLEEANRVSSDTAVEKQFSGFADMSIGSFFSPQASLWYGQNYGNYAFESRAAYYRTDGYAPHTDRSGENFYAMAKTSLLSENLFLKSAVAEERLEAASQKFSFYGSAVPEQERRISTIFMTSSIENMRSPLLPFTVAVSLQSTSVVDSSVTSTENNIEALLTLPYTLWSRPMETHVDILMSSWGTSYIQFNTGLSRYSWNGVLFDASLHIYRLEVKSRQNTLILMPQCRLSFAFSPEHTLFAAYIPDADKTTFSRLLEINRYLPASVSFEQTVVPERGEAGIESQWSSQFRSRITAGVEFSSDELLFAESPQGAWEVIPSGRTTLLTFRAEMVAKFLANDYFASGIIFCSTENSTFGSSLPYKAKIEWKGLAEHTFMPALKVSATFRFLGARRSDIINEEYLPAFFVLNVSSEYYFLQAFVMQLDLMNVTNERYELWRGYQEFPFTCSIGLKYKW